MWHIGTFRPVTLFSLRPANATVSGGKTLVTPTPFAFKMALLDAALRVLGRQEGMGWWPSIRDLAVAVSLPEAFLVVKSFQRILRPGDGGGDEEDSGNGRGSSGPWKTNIAYREYVHYEASATLAFALRPAPDALDLPWEWLLSQVHYLGKRGGFFQYVGYSTHAALPPDYTLLTEASGAFRPGGLMQMLDDCGAGMTFDHADVYSPKTRRLSINSPDGRILRLVVLPYQQTHAGRGYTAYHRLAGSDG